MTVNQFRLKMLKTKCESSDANESDRTANASEAIMTKHVWSGSNDGIMLFDHWCYFHVSDSKSLISMTITS